MAPFGAATVATAPKVATPRPPPERNIRNRELSCSRDTEKSNRLQRAFTDREKGGITQRDSGMGIQGLRTRKQKLVPETLPEAATARLLARKATRKATPQTWNPGRGRNGK
jgi:hypothetical protein